MCKDGAFWDPSSVCTCKHKYVCFYVSGYVPG